MVSWEQRIMEGDAKFEASQDVHKFNYAAYAEILGFEGIRIEKEEDIIPAIERAMQAQRPVVVDVLSDPSVPPLPPHISFEQARNYTSALLKGDPDIIGIVQQSFREMIKSYIH